MEHALNTRTRKLFVFRQLPRHECQRTTLAVVWSPCPPRRCECKARNLVPAGSQCLQGAPASSAGGPQPCLARIDWSLVGPGQTRCHQAGRGASHVSRSMFNSFRGNRIPATPFVKEVNGLILITWRHSWTIPEFSIRGKSGGNASLTRAVFVQSALSVYASTSSTAVVS
jgi:hypothetical protein